MPLPPPPRRRSPRRAGGPPLRRARAEAPRCPSGARFPLPWFPRQPPRGPRCRRSRARGRRRREAQVRRGVRSRSGPSRNSLASSSGVSTGPSPSATTSASAPASGLPTHHASVSGARLPAAKSARSSASESANTTTPRGVPGTKGMLPATSPVTVAEPVVMLSLSPGDRPRSRASSSETSTGMSSTGLKLRSARCAGVHARPKTDAPTSAVTVLPSNSVESGRITGSCPTATAYHSPGDASAPTTSTEILAAMTELSSGRSPPSTTSPSSRSIAMTFHVPCGNGS